MPTTGDIKTQDKQLKLDKNQEVILVSPITLKKLFNDQLELKDNNSSEKVKLTIPDYQRIYCWSEKNVYQLLDDIMNMESVLHLGNIIVHNTKRENKTLNQDENVLNIIDGQQRLVTLSLILYCLEQSKENNPLLNEKFESELAENYIKYNFHIINEYLNNRYKNINRQAISERIRTHITFSLVILNEDSIDLAYTFFSTQNSLGVKLTDYDLLKSHHLRYVYYPKQAEHVAKKWDTILLTKDKDLSLNEVMGRYLFRLRKWYKQENWYDKKVYKVKNEFEAALILPEVPPFGEKFLYYEPIQGGTHFFAFTDIFIDRCRNFFNTSAYKSLNTHMWWKSLKVFKQVMDVHLFAYYLKFGDSYLGEALYCISRVISDYRFNTERYNYQTLINHDNNKKIIRWIETSTSPTFFLANCLDLINKKMLINKADHDKGIRKSYYEQLNKMYNDVKDNMTSDSIIFSLNKFNALE